MKKMTVLFILLGLLGLSAISEGADWVYFIQNINGDKYYIDVESIQRVTPEIVRVSRKIEPAASEYSHTVSSMELDCSNRKVRLIQTVSYMKNGEVRTTADEGKWLEIRSDDMEDTLLELACSLKRSK